MDTRIYIYISEQRFNKNAVKEIVSFSRDSLWTLSVMTKSLLYWRSIWFWWPFVSGCFTNLSGDFSLISTTLPVAGCGSGDGESGLRQSRQAEQPVSGAGGVTPHLFRPHHPCWPLRTQAICSFSWTGAEQFEDSSFLPQPFRQFMQSWWQSLHFMKSFSLSDMNSWNKTVVFLWNAWPINSTV